MQERIPQSVAKLVVFKAFLSTDHVTAATGKTIAMQVSQNGGAFANLDGGALNATEISVGWYKAQLQTADTDTKGPLVVRGTETDCDPFEVVYTVVNPTNADFTALPAVVAGAASGIPLKDASSFLDVANMPAVAAGGAGGLFIAGTNAATIITTSLTTHFVGTVDTVTTLSTWDGAVDVTKWGGTALASSVIPAGWLGTGAGQISVASGVVAASGDWNTTTPPTAAANADAVWDEISTGHVSAGKAGQQLWTDLDLVLGDTGELQTNQGAWATATGFATPTNITAASGVSLASSQHVIVDSGTVTTVSNQLTAAAIATGVWQDATAGDFTTASSIGKSLFNDGAAPGATGGLAILGSLMGLTAKAITSAKYDESSAFPVKSADTGETKIARVGADSDTLEDLSDQIDIVTGGGGATTDTITVKSPDGAKVLDGADVWITDDSGGTDSGTRTAGSKYTNHLGQVTFQLEDGTYWVHVQLSGYDFSETYPQRFTVSGGTFS